MIKATDNHQVEVSLIVPAHNEVQRNIGSNCRLIFAYLEQQEFSSEVILVDDGSTDGTSSAIESAITAAGADAVLLRNDKNRGKGYSVRRGMLAARGRFRFFFDADLSTPPGEINRFLPQLKKTPVVIGSRYLPDSRIEIAQPRVRAVLGGLFRKLAAAIVLRNVRDPQCGFKGFGAEAAEAVFGRLRVDRMAFDTEALFIARKLGYNIEEVPVTWRHVETNTIPAGEGVRALVDLVRIRIYDIRGEYER